MQLGCLFPQGNHLKSSSSKPPSWHEDFYVIDFNNVLQTFLLSKPCNLHFIAHEECVVLCEDGLGLLGRFTEMDASP